MKNKHNSSKKWYKKPRLIGIISLLVLITIFFSSPYVSFEKGEYRDSGDPCEKDSDCSVYSDCDCGYMCVGTSEKYPTMGLARCRYPEKLCLRGVPEPTCECIDGNCNVKEPITQYEMEENRFTCKNDKECRNTCSYGAVNKYWLENHKDRCEDGCAGRTITEARCINESCVAFDFKGRKAPDCTKREPVDSYE